MSDMSNVAGTLNNSLLDSNLQTTTQPPPGEGIKKGRWRTIFPRFDEPPIRSAAPLSSCLLVRLRCRIRRKYRYELAALVARLERDMAVCRREKRVVTAHTDVFAGMELG